MNKHRTDAIASGFAWERDFFGSGDILSFEDSVWNPGPQNPRDYGRFLRDSFNQARNWAHQKRWDPARPPHNCGAAKILTTIKRDRRISYPIVRTLEILPTTGTRLDHLGIDGIITDPDDTCWARFDLKVSMPRYTTQKGEVKAYTPTLIYRERFEELYESYAEQLIQQLLSKIQIRKRRAAHR